jgi:hypothetical protein
LVAFGLCRLINSCNSDKTVLVFSTQKVNAIDAYLI